MTKKTKTEGVDHTVMDCDGMIDNSGAAPPHEASKDLKGWWWSFLVAAQREIC